MKEVNQLFAVIVPREGQADCFLRSAFTSTTYLAWERETAEVYCKGIAGAKVVPVTATVEECE